jgi:hypothetical protein
MWVRLFFEVSDHSSDKGIGAITNYHRTELLNHVHCSHRFGWSSHNRTYNVRLLRGSLSKGGFSNKQMKTDAIALIQRFGSALNLNTHFHMLFLEGAIIENT